MPLIVEDGSGKTDANSYADLTELSAYLTARGMASFTGLASDSAREAATLRAMRWLENHYRQRWQGRRSNQRQALAWPRYNVQDQDGFVIESDEIPQVLKDALAEAAEREAQSAGSLAPDLARGGAVQQEVKKVGPIETSTTYFAHASSTKKFPIIDEMLGTLLCNSSKVYRT